MLKEYKIDDFNDVIFENEVHNNEPFIIRGLELNGLKDKWTQDYFESINNFKSKIVPVMVSSKAKVHAPVKDYEEDKKVYFGESKEMPIIDALRHALSTDNSDYYYNLLEAQIPELFSDIPLPEFVRNRGVWGNLWVGNYNTTRLHFDVFNNFYFQIKGKKKFILCKPDSYLHLYPVSSNTSSIKNIEDASEKQFPLLKYVEKINVTLEEGDFLYLPSFWWHHVQSVEPYISYNYWGIPHIESYMCASGSYYICKHFEIGDFCNLYYQHTKALSNWNYTYIEMSQRLLYKGYNWISVLLLLSFLENYLINACKVAQIDLTSQLAEIEARLEKFKNRPEEVNVRTITNETIAEDRLSEISNAAYNNQLLDKNDIDNIKSWINYIKPAKIRDNLALRPERINDMILGLETLINKNMH